LTLPLGPGRGLELEVDEDKNIEQALRHDGFEVV